MVGGTDGSTVGETTGVIDSVTDVGTIGTDSDDGVVAIVEGETGIVGGTDDSDTLLEITVGGSGTVEDRGNVSSVGATKDVGGKVDDV